MSTSSSDVIGTPPQTGEITEASRISPSSLGNAEIATPKNLNEFNALISGQSIIIDDNPPENQMLSRKKLCIERPEQLAVLDFQAVSTSDFQDAEDKNTKLFNERVTKRIMQIDSAVASLQSAAELDSDNYEEAVKQYESAIAAAASEIALLKIAYTFKVYAKIGPSWTSFIKNYSFNATEFFGDNASYIDTSSMGTNFSNYMNNTMSWAGYQTQLGYSVSSGKDLSLLLQLILDLSFSCCFATPAIALKNTRFQNPGDNLTTSETDGTNPISRMLAIYYDNSPSQLKYSPPDDKVESSFKQSSTGLVRISRDLTASAQLAKIAAAQGDEDENLKTHLEKYVDSDFFTSTTKKSRSMFAYVFGWDHFGSVVPDGSQVRSLDKKEYYVEDFKNYTSGLVSNFFTLDKATIIVSTDSDSYQSGPSVIADSVETIPSQTYGGVEDLVEQAFSSEDGINLGLYESAVRDFQDSLEDSAFIFKQLFKLLDKRGSTLVQGIEVAKSTHPSSPLALYAQIVKIFNERFYTKSAAYLGLAPELLRDSSWWSVGNYYKCWGIFAMIKFPEFSKKVLEKFVDDYHDGFLTFTDKSTTETKDDGTEYEVRENVYPGTSTSVNLSNTKGSLFTYLQNAWTEIPWPDDGWLVTKRDQDDCEWYYLPDMSSFIYQPRTPGDALCGLIYTEKMKAESYSYLNFGTTNQVGFDDTWLGGTHDPADYIFEQTYINAGIVSEFQKMSVWWLKADQDGVVYPGNIVGVAAGIIDAVMTVLYSTLSETMGIESASSSDSVWPAIDSTSPPYQVQVWNGKANNQDEGIPSFTIPAGMGSIEDLNTTYWIPVLDALSQKIVRSEDKTTYFANASLSSFFEGIIDAFAGVSPTAATDFTIHWGGKLEDDADATFPCTMNCSRNDSSDLAVPTISTVSTYSGEHRAFDVTNSFTAGVGFAAVMTLDIVGSLAAMAASGGESISVPANNYNASYDDVMSMTYDTGYAWVGDSVSIQTSGVGMAVFAGVKGAGSLSGDLVLQATASGNLDKIWGISDWQEVWYDILLHTYAVAMAVYLATPEDGIMLDPVALMESFVGSAIEAEAQEDAALFSTIDPNSIQPGLWLMALAGGHDTGTSPAYQPFGDLLNLTMEELKTQNSLAVPTICTSEADSIWDSDTKYGNSILLGEFLTVMQNIISFRDEDIRLGIGFDMIQKYAQRISDYSETAIDGLQTEDQSSPSALETLLEELSQTSAGIDVLQNLNPLQLSLKQAGLNRQKGDPAKGYISFNEILNENDINAIKTLMSEESIVGVEGLNMKTSVIGIPATMFSLVYGDDATYSGPTGDTLPEITSGGIIKGKNSPLFGIKVQSNAPDYPALQFYPKMFRFDYELFCFPETVWKNVDWELINNFDDLVRAATFTRVRYIVDEGSQDSSNSIVKIDETREERMGLFSDPDSFKDIYHNTLASYILEIYYKLMVGLSLSEDDLTYAAQGLEIPINDYAIDFASALASIYTDLESDLSQEKIDELFMPSIDIEGLSYNALTPSAASNASVSTYKDMLDTFQSEISSGEFGEVEASLFEGFTNASTSRLMSAESMRDKIIGAKYFDRVVYLLADPDEFLIYGPAWYSYYLGSIDDSSISASEAAARNTEKEQKVSDYSDWIDNLLENEKIIAVPSADLDEDPDPSGSWPTYEQFYKFTTREDEGNLSFSSWYTTVVRSTTSLVSGDSKPGNNYTLDNSAPQDYMISSAAVTYL